MAYIVRLLDFWEIIRLVFMSVSDVSSFMIFRYSSLRVFARSQNLKLTPVQPLSVTQMLFTRCLQLKPAMQPKLKPNAAIMTRSD